MPRGVGPALEKAIRAEPADRHPPAGSGVLFHPTRQEIYRQLFRNPLSALAGISKALGIPEGTVRWHLDKLLKGEYVRAAPTNPPRYYPAGFVSPEEFPAFEALSAEGARQVLQAIVEVQGSTPAEIGEAAGISRHAVSRSLESLSALALVHSIADGNRRRYFLSGGLLELVASHRERVKNFTRTLLRKLEADGVHPQVVRHRLDELSVNVNRGGSRALVVIPLNPFGPVEF